MYHNTDIYVAGGFFVAYQDNSPFAHKYPELYDHYKRKQDIDIWIKATSDLEKYIDVSRINELNIIYSYYRDTSSERFDFECSTIHMK